MKKVVFALLALSAGLCSCSQSDEPNNVPDKYVSVTIGTKSEVLEKSIIEPGGTTSWDVNDVVNIIDANGTVQPFTYADETAKASAKFTGLLLANQGSQVYKAYHAPENSIVSLNGQSLFIERKDIEIDEHGIENNSAMFGSYCPMVAMPVEFDANDTSGDKPLQFYQLMSMIEGRVSLRTEEDGYYLAKRFDEVRFEIQANGSMPFYKTIELALDRLTVDSKVGDINECIVNNGNSEMTDYMCTIMHMEERSIAELKEEYKKLGSFPIPIFALPTDLEFDYTATVSFYYKGNPQLILQGSATAERLNPVGLNVLNFDHNKIVPIYN